MLRQSLRVALVRALPALGLLVGCGDGQPARAPAAAQGAQTSGAEIALPPIPEEPLVLVPGNVNTVLVLDLERLRDSSHSEMLHAWGARLSCTDAAEGHWLLDGTQEVVAALRSVEGGEGTTPGQTGAGASEEQAFALLRGEFENGARGRALREAAQTAQLPGADLPSKVEQRGRFEVERLSRLAAVQLSDELLAIGDAAAIAALLDLADGRTDARFVDGAFYRERAREAFTGRALSFAAWPDDSARARLADELDGVGATELVRGLEGTVGSVTLQDDVGAEIQATYASAEAATAAANAARQLYFQGNLLLRLTGMPRIFERAQAQADGTRVRYSLEISASDIATLRQRVDWLLDAATEGHCDGGGR